VIRYTRFKQLGDTQMQYEILVDKIMYKPSLDQIVLTKFLDQNNWRLPNKGQAELLQMTIRQGGFYTNPFFAKAGTDSIEQLKDHFSQSKLRQLVINHDYVIPLRRMEKGEVPHEKMCFFNAGRQFNRYIFNRDRLILKIDEMEYQNAFGDD
jgi:hypothetical protein